MSATRHVTANETRFPQPQPGEVIVVTKYGQSGRKAVIVHPDDFDLLERYRRIFARHEPYEMKLSATALAAHDLGERGEDESEIDHEALDRALG